MRSLIMHFTTDGLVSHKVIGVIVIKHAQDEQHRASQCISYLLHARSYLFRALYYFIRASDLYVSVDLCVCVRAVSCHTT